MSIQQTTIKQSEINAAAWAACDTFRGAVDPSNYKDYILVMLFLKYISDVWKDHYEEYQKQYGDNKERIQRKLERERFILPEGTSFYDLFEKRNDVNIGEQVNIALDKIEEANKSKLEGVFRNIDFNSEANLGRTKDRNRRLKIIFEDFNRPELDMRPSRISEDVIGNTYIYLIEKFASSAGKKAGEFYTPAGVSDLLAKLAKPQKGDTICHPACGSVGLLISAAKEIGNNDFALYGMEVNGSTWALARMNMFLHGMDSARIEWCDTLNTPALVDHDSLLKFDLVLANPPFSLDKWGAENADNDRYNRFWRGVPPKSKGDYAFISHMIETSKEREGRVAVIVPHGVLFRGGAEGRIRQRLIEDNVLDAVIGLPSNLFTTTSIPVAILIFDRSREQGGQNEKENDVLFIDASKDYKPGKNQNTFEPEHIEKIVQAYEARKSIEKYAHVATFEEIKENDFNLNIPRYVDTFEEEPEVDLKALQAEIDQLESELVEVRKEIKTKMKEMGLE